MRPAPGGHVTIKHKLDAPRPWAWLIVAALAGLAVAYVLDCSLERWPRAGIEGAP